MLVAKRSFPSFLDEELAKCASCETKTIHIPDTTLLALYNISAIFGYKNRRFVLIFSKCHRPVTIRGRTVSSVLLNEIVTQMRYAPVICNNYRRLQSQNRKKITLHGNKPIKYWVTSITRFSSFIASELLVCQILCNSSDLFVSLRNATIE